MSSKKEKLNKLGLIGIFVLIVAICTICLLFSEYTVAQMRQNITETMLTEQMRYTKETVDNLSFSDNAEQAVEFIKGLKSDGSHSWFAIVDNRVVFSKSTQYTDELTAEYTDTDNIIDYYIRNGGDATQLNNYKDKLNAREDFSDVIFKEASYGNEMISVCFTDINGEECAFGYSVRLNYLLSDSKFNLSIVCLRVTVLLICILFVICCGTVAVRKYFIKKTNLKLEKDLIIKNKFIHNNNDRIDNNSVNPSITTIDKVTGLYTKQFTSHLMQKLTIDEIDTVGIVYIDICGTDFDEKDVKNIAEILKDNTIDRQVCTAISGSRFSVLFLNESKNYVMNTLTVIKIKLAELKGIHCNQRLKFCDEKNKIMDTINSAI